MHGAPGALLTFQFHIGSIKSMLIYFLRSLLSKFQFHIGSIKSQTGANRCSSRLGFNSILVQLKVNIRRGASRDDFLFQFHIGSIKRTVTTLEPVELFERFNSILVQLKGPHSVGVCVRQNPFQFHIGSIKSNGIFAVAPVG